MLEIEHNPKLTTVKLEFGGEIAEELQEFVRYSETEYEHATNGLVLRAILRKVVNSSSKWRGFHDWRSRSLGQEESEDGDPAVQGSEPTKTAESESVKSDEGEGASAFSAAENEDAPEADEGFAAKTGTIKVDQGDKKGGSRTGRRQIQRGEQ